MTGKDVYKIWTPVKAKWVDWVRPVPFALINDEFKSYEIGDFIIPTIDYIQKSISGTAIIVDLPGNDSIKEGLALAKLGFRPIPIYNGTETQEGAMPTVDNHSIVIGLVKGALELQKMNLSNNAMPAFLLDSNRMNRYKMDFSVFDNSWDIYAQDMPSAEYFLQNGIKKIIIRGEKIQKDLKKILYKFQEKGMEILFTNGYGEPKRVRIRYCLNIRTDI